MENANENLKSKKRVSFNNEANWQLQNKVNFLMALPIVARQIQHNKVILLDDDWNDLASFALQIVTGFDLPFFGSNNNDEDFKELNDRLDAISSKLDSISNGIQQIIIDLEKLPDEIRGIVDEALLRQYVADQRTHVQLLRPYLRDKESFNASGNLTTIQDLILKLAEDVNRIIAVTGGKMAGFSMSCSGFAAWAQAKTMVLNIKSANPSEQTVWDQDFFSANMAMIKDLFTNAEKISAQYAIDSQNTPGLSTGFRIYWKYINGAFQKFKAPVPGYFYVPDIHKFTNMSQEGWTHFSIIKYVPLTNLPPPIHLPIHPPKWPIFISVNDSSINSFEHPDLVRAADNLWKNEILPHVIEVNNFNAVFEDFEAIKNKVYAATTKPKSQRKSSK